MSGKGNVINACRVHIFIDKKGLGITVALAPIVHEFGAVKAGEEYMEMERAATQKIAEKSRDIVEKIFALAGKRKVFLETDSKANENGEISLLGCEVYCCEGELVYIRGAADKAFKGKFREYDKQFDAYVRELFDSIAGKVNRLVSKMVKLTGTKGIVDLQERYEVFCTVS